MADLRVNIGALTLRNPVMTASGTFGYGLEFQDFVPLDALGGIIVKGTTLHPREGNDYPRMAETAGGMLNCVGLQNKGVDYFAEHIYPQLKDIDTNVLVNVSGSSPDDYAECAARIDALDGIPAIELNISCPNVKAGGHTFGQDPKVLAEVVSAVRKATKLPLIVKLAPNVPSIVPYVKACEDAGADALSMINTIPAMVIDIEKRVPMLANVTGGLSGRGIHPAAVKLVHDAHRATKLPILAMGGVYEPKDAVEFFLAGATAVAVGTATFSNPGVVAEVYDGVVAYCERHGFASVSDLTGALS